MPVIPINTNTQPSRFILIIVLLSHVRESSQMAFSVSVAAKGLFNSVNFQLNHFQALQRTYAEAANFIHLA
jgi:preprotein translocase subunit SecB